MGSQTLEILRQGVWASLTGGWFYDPHLDVFSNTFHLYVWLFLLCLPFIIYLYFPPSLYVWLAYCSSIFVLFGTIKSINHVLHCVYDTTECLEEPGQSTNQQKYDGEKRRSFQNKRREQNQDQMDLGIELQVLNGKTDTPPVECSSRNSFAEASMPNMQNIDVDAESIISDYMRHKPNSTIDLKVEIHRKNSSESSEEASQMRVHNDSVAPNNSHEQDPMQLSYGRKLKVYSNGPADPNESVNSSQHKREHKIKRDRSRGKCVVIAEDDLPRVSKLCRHASEDSRNCYEDLNNLEKICSESQIKQTDSLELEPDDEYSYWKNTNKNWHARRMAIHPSQDQKCTDLRQSLEYISKDNDSERNNISSHPQSLEMIPKKHPLQLVHHPQSLEVIGASSFNKNAVSTDDNNLPLHPQSLETINSKKVLPQNTLKRNRMLQLPLDDTVNPIVEQKIERIVNFNYPSCSISEYSKQGKNDEIANCSNNHAEINERYKNDKMPISSNSQDTLIEDYDVLSKKRYSNASQSSWELSVNEREKPRREKSKDLEDSTNTGSIFGIDRLFVEDDFGVESWANKNLHTKDSDSGSSSMTNLSLDNEVKRKLLPQSEMDNKRQQGAIPKQNRPKVLTVAVNPTTDGPPIVKTPGELPAPRLNRHRNKLSKVHLRRQMQRQPRMPVCPSTGEASSNNGHLSAYNSGLSHVRLYSKYGYFMSNGDEYHLATSHNDTSEGAVHYFHENGKLMTYAFDEKGSGIASVAQIPDTDRVLTNLLARPKQRPLSPRYDPTPDLSPSFSDLSLNSANLTVIIDTPPVLSSPATSQPKTQNSLPSNIVSTNEGVSSNQCNLETPDWVREDLDRRLRSVIANLTARFERGNNPTSVLANHQNSDLTSHGLSWNRIMDCLDDSRDMKSKNTRHYYKWKIGGLSHVKLRFDRLALLALLDRNLTTLETIASTLLALIVAGLGLFLLQKGFYKDIFAFLFCFVTAGCQYSLLKSVQPDASSPTHGFNRIVVFSRPIYYIMCTSLVLILNASLENFPNSDFRVYGFKVADRDVALQSRNVLLIFLLCFPVVFSLGLFPQINTFLMYLFEHVDIHIFGGNATTSLISSIYCLFRSIVTVIILYGFAYGALTEAKSSQHILFSIFCGLLVAISYHLSRSSSDPSVIWDIVKTNLWPPEIYLEEKEATVIDADEKKETDKSKAKPTAKEQKTKKDADIVMGEQATDSELVDPLPQKLRATVKARLKNDIIICAVVGVLSFAIHASTVFTALQPELNPVLWGISCCLGFLLHYILPQLRKQLPWLCLARPVLRSFEFAKFEVHEPVRIMWFEKVYVYLCFVERNVLYPLVFLGALTECSPKIIDHFGSYIGTVIVVVCGLKALRSSYSDPSTRYLVIAFSVLFFCIDYAQLSETFLVDYFVTGILFSKIYELLLKIRFVVTYIAPWQITWGSAFHAFAQPFSVPHSAMLFLQAAISAVLSTPLNPLLGSAIFISSYVRPVKFWERDYKTRRVDHSNTRMSSHLERNLGADDNNLNSIFYEQLTRSLQHSLYGDLALGRWGTVEQGDCFLLASDYLNCLVHVIQLGNGLVTFQLRGLEFRGTYCQQREVEAISEGVEDNSNCCCCEMGHISSNVLSVNAAFSQRWLAWEVASAKYVLEGYSISDNSAGSMLQVFDFRKVLVTYYVKSIIFYAIKSTKLEQWLANSEITEALEATAKKNFVDLDPIFNINIDEDYDFHASGITRNSFCSVYLEWIQFCATKQEISDKSRDSNLVSLCFALSLLGRRVLGAASHNTVSNVEFFLYGLHALFKGDFRITSIRDEWVLHDVDLLRSVVAKGVRMALKLHQDHFMMPEQYEEAVTLHDAIDNHDQNLVISHEADPLWRNAVLSGAPSLLALRHVLDDGIDEYKVIMLNKRYLSFRVIKMNRECVRGLWAGQQQELVYLRNRNPERGSIQNAKQALRNIINSSCDQPIGYPIYVSPLTTSYAETNEQLCSIVGGPLSLKTIKATVLDLVRRARRRCGQGCSSGGTASQDDGGFGNDNVYAMPMYNIHSGYSQSGHNTSASQSMDSGCQIGGSAGRGSLGPANTGSLGGNRGSLASVGKPTSSTLASLAGLLSNSEVKTESKSETSFTTTKMEKDDVMQRVRIVDPNYVYDAINLGRRIDVIWPDEKMRQQGGRSGWQHWVPERGMEGCVVHRWLPNHRDPNRRSHVDKVILLVKIDDKFVPIAEQGVRDLGVEV